MKRETKQLIVALIILVFLMILTYFFSPQYKYRKMKEDFSDFISKDVVSDYVGIINDEYDTKIRTLISRFSEQFKTDFFIIILPDIKDYDPKEILNFFYDSRVKKNHFGILMLILPEQGKVNIEFDKRLRFVIEETKINNIIENHLLASFRKAEREYSEMLKNKENIKNIKSKNISKGIFDTIDGIGKEIMKEYPYLEKRIASEHGNNTLITIRNWLGYVIIVIIGIVIFANIMKKRCPRCHHKMKLVRVATSSGNSFMVYKCPSCGYLRRKNKGKRVKR